MVILRILKTTSLSIFITLFLFSVNIESALAQVTLGKWERYVISLSNSTYSGNPFLLEVDATFTHSDGTKLKMPGYYDGSNTWEIGFMPTKTGTWTYITSSADSDLNGKTGSISVIESGHPGMMVADPINPNKWKYIDGDYVLPIGLFANAMMDTATNSEFTQMADFMVANNLKLLNFRISEQDFAFASASGFTMELNYWNRLEERMKILTDRGLGVNIMLYTDNGNKPSFPAYSEAEYLLIRYTVARLAGFPIVSFNSGIDIWEYRDQAWIDWYGQQIKSIDPFNHPVSSRRSPQGAYPMSGQTYNSDGSRNSKMSRLLTAYNVSDNTPAANNDNWSEDMDTGNINGHTREDIRRAAWKALVAGGVEFHVRHNVSNCFLNDSDPNNDNSCDRYFDIKDIHTQLDSEHWLSLVNPYLQTNLGNTFGQMEPDTSVVGGAAIYALADNSKSKILYLLIGSNDSRDSGTGSGGNVTMKLSGISGKTYSAKWYDPRTGTESIAGQGTYISGSDYTLTPPSQDDWILLLSTGQSGSTPAPTLTASPATPTPTSTPIPGDGNKDGVVDGLDYLVWLNNYDTSTSGGTLAGDYDFSGFVDGLDYLVWLRNYGF